MKERDMKRIRAAVAITRRTSVEFEVDDDADTEEIKQTVLDEAELAEWDDDPPDVVSIQIIDDLS
jgi:aspartate-semialdehyde dehydrogenase